MTIATVILQWVAPPTDWDVVAQQRKLSARPTMPNSLHRRAWLLPLLPLLLVACDDRVEQCNTLIGRLNPHTEAMIAGVEGLARIESDPGSLTALVSAIDTADQDLAVIELPDQRLAGFALRYRKQLMDARAAGEAMKAAVASKDAMGLHAAAKQADAFLDAQAKTVEELNAYCSGE